VHANKFLSDPARRKGTRYGSLIRVHTVAIHPVNGSVLGQTPMWPYPSSIAAWMSHWHSLRYFYLYLSRGTALRDVRRIAIKPSVPVVIRQASIWSEERKPDVDLAILRARCMQDDSRDRYRTPCERRLARYTSHVSWPRIIGSIIKRGHLALSDYHVVSSVWVSDIR
jgi:hypothetical protein